MKPLAISLLLISTTFAAEPDWPKVEQHSLEFLQTYIRIPTIDPPADTRKAAELFKTELEAHGFAPKLYPSGPDGKTILIVRLAGRDRAKKPLLLMNHFDVVPVDRAAWGAIDPFAAEIKDGILWGRGSLDMKGVGVMQLTALILLKDLGIVPDRDIVMLCDPDEEAGGEYGIKWMVNNHRDEIDAEWVIDEGGFGSRDALAKQSGKLMFGIAVGEKHLMWVRLRAKGTAGHGSQPIAENANMILVEAIGKALALSAAGKQSRTVGEMIRSTGGLAPNKYINAIQQNTISLTSMTSGLGNPPKANVIPSIAEATLDCRLLPGVNSDEFISEMKARINDPRVTVELINHSDDAGESPSDTPAFKAMVAAILAHHPSAVVTPMLVPYGTDSNVLRKLGIPAYGFIPMVLDTATLATMHSDAERIPVAEFLKGLRIYFDLLRMLKS
jgi:acetylornithine deacetylase/succinyl-diaminopimelate desuccinylase-like protein